MNDKIKRKLEKLDPDGKALLVSDSLMTAEAALEDILAWIEEQREHGERPDLARGYLCALRGFHLIRAGHMELTEADAMVFNRPIPRSR